MVDSPTPIVPISSDSTRTMSSNGPSRRPRAAATTQPAVPPPAMTTRLTIWPCIKTPPAASAIQAIDQVGAEPPRLHLVERAEIAAGMFGQMLARAFWRTEDIIVEQLPPSLFLWFRAVAQA